MNQNFKQWIIEQAKYIGIDKIGFTHAGDFEHLRQDLTSHKEKNRQTGFEHANLDERLNPKNLMSDAKSIISIALAYPSQIKKDELEKLNNVPRGQFARSSWGNDYHRVLHDKMNQLTRLIKQKADNTARFLPMVDTGALIDVAVAERAGLGLVGRNGLLITKEFGSFVYLGEIITNLEFEPDEPITASCGDCMRCIEACPSGAFLGDGKMDSKKCLSYVTQAKGVMPLEYREKIGNVIYGCDICQLVCPHNQGKDFHLHEELRPIADDVMPDLAALVQMSNKEFRKRFGYLAGAWRGKSLLQRNGIYALGNLKGTCLIPLLEELAEHDEREEIRDAAKWGVSRLKSKLD